MSNWTARGPLGHAVREIKKKRDKPGVGRYNNGTLVEGSPADNQNALDTIEIDPCYGLDLPGAKPQTNIEQPWVAYQGSAAADRFIVPLGEHQPQTP